MNLKSAVNGKQLGMGFLVLIFLNPLQSQDVPMLQMGTWLDSGQHFIYQCAHQEIYIDPATNDTATTHYNIEIEVLAKNDTACFLSATYRNVIADSQSSAESQFISSLINGLNIQYQTNLDGKLIRIRNVNDMKFYLLGSYTLAMEEFKGPAEEKNKLLTIQPFVTSDQFVMQACEEIPMMSHFAGSVFRLDTVNVEPSSFPNALADSTFPAISEVTVHDVGSDGRMHISQKSRINYDLGGPMIISTIKNIFKEKGIPIPSDSVLIQMIRYSEDLEVTMQMPKSWLTALYFEKHSGFGSTENVSITRMTLLN